MNENRGRRGPGLGLLLLIPAALIIAKGARRRRAMWAGAEYGHHHGFGPGGMDPERRAEFRLPPKIEWMLDSWHTRAHETATSTEPAAPAKSTGTATV